MPSLPTSKRLREVLASLMRGLSEKQVALRLGISRHTVHHYTKAIYRFYGVCSRSELLCLWLVPPEELAVSLGSRLDGAAGQPAVSKLRSNPD